MTAEERVAGVLRRLLEPFVPVLGGVPEYLAGEVLECIAPAVREASELEDYPVGTKFIAADGAVWELGGFQDDVLLASEGQILYGAQAAMAKLIEIRLIYLPSTPGGGLSSPDPSAEPGAGPSAP